MNAVTWGTGRPCVPVRGTGDRYGRMEIVLPRKRVCYSSLMLFRRSRSRN